MRVAVIAVHGVADQKQGDTADQIAHLLVSSSPSRSAYTASASEKFVLNVPPLDLGDAARTDDASPTSASRPVAKAIVQSVRSDFLREKANPVAAESIDPGVATTRFLLAKAVRNGASAESYASERIAMERTQAGAKTTVDLYEMYWADLSRLSGALPRIVTELFTMVFRLSRLGRDTVDTSRQYFRQRGHGPLGGAAWRALTWLQIGLDWAFVNVLAQLFAQMFLVGVLLIAFGAVNQMPGAIKGTGIALVVAGVLWLLYLGFGGGGKSAVALLLVACATGMIASPAAGPWLFGLVMLALVTVAYDVGLRIADDRFPFVRTVGLVIWLVVLFLVGWRVWFVGLEPQAPPTEQLFQVTLYGVELTLIGITWWWILFAVPFALWMLATLLAGRGGFERSASVTTGRLGFLASIGVFVVLTMALWALLFTPLQWAAKGVDYRAILPVFQTSGESAAAAAARQCSLYAEKALSPEETKARQEEKGAEVFLRHRYENSTAAFAAVAALLIVLVLHVLVTFCPSILAELKLLQPKARASADEAYPASRRLGVWLTFWYRLLAWSVLVVALLGAVVAIVIAIHFFLPQGVFRSGVADLSDADCVPWASTELLKPLVFSAAGLAAALAAFGSLLSRYLPGVRAPLDTLLDVDNYFREFPRRSIPRARIFSRYHALLRHVRSLNYDRIVIVAHSQGTVISAEMLRLLSDPAVAASGQQDRRKNIESEWCGDVRLLTLGSPLRQLYAARFPCQYAWVLTSDAANGAARGPSAAAIGVHQWGNAFTSGDYVGRWLWSAKSESADARPDPLADAADPMMPGATDPYWPPVESRLADPSFAAKTEFDVCVGLGAHTHYFEPDQKVVAGLIDRLIAAPALPKASGS